MKKRYILLCVAFLVCCFVACSKNNEIKKVSRTLGIDIPDGIIIDNVDTHGGFHGDGYTFLEISFNDVAGASIADDIAQNSNWSAFPLTKNLHKAVYGKEDGISIYGACVTDDEGEAIIPEIKNGDYYFYDRNSESKDPKDDTDLFNRYSYNFTIALYDRDNNILYYYELDT